MPTARAGKQEPEQQNLHGVGPWTSTEHRMEESKQQPRRMFHAGEVVHMGLERGTMVLIQGLKSKPELNGKIAVITGPADNGRVPCTVAPVLPTDVLARIAAKPVNLEIKPHPPDIMATAWNNVALALKRSNALVEANGAFMTANEFAPPGSSIQLNSLANWIKLCTAMGQAGVADAGALQDKISSLMGQLFAQVTSRPELHGLDCVYGLDFVPGYSQRQLFCGISNSVDAQPVRQHGQNCLLRAAPLGLRAKRRASTRGCRRKTTAAL